MIAFNFVRDFDSDFAEEHLDLVKKKKDREVRVLIQMACDTWDMHQRILGSENYEVLHVGLPIFKPIFLIFRPTFSEKKTKAIALLH